MVSLSRKLKSLKRSNYIIFSNNDCSRFYCNRCGDVLLDPVQSLDGSRYCSSCATNLSDYLLRDRAIERELLDLNIRCINPECTEILRLKHLDGHLSECKFHPEECRYCGKTYSIVNKEKHLLNVCEMFPITCDFCGLSTTRRYFETKHRNPSGSIEDICDKWCGACPFQCDLTTVHKSIKQHLINCENKLEQCSLRRFGCVVIGKRKCINEHMRKDSGDHLRMVIDEVIRMESENENRQKLFKDREEKIVQKMNILEKMNDELDCQVKLLTKSIETKEKQLNVMKMEMNNYKELLDEVNDIDLSLMENGEFQWVVENIREKVADAKSGAHVCCQSKLFYTGRPGYRMRLKLYPNGDGQGKNTHLSIYFILLKGDFDNSIKWPFSQKVTFKLKNKRKDLDISVKMVSDGDLRCYGKPMTDFNLGAGLPLFVPLNTLITDNDFIHDGSIIISILISDVI